MSIILALTVILVLGTVVAGVYVITREIDQKKTRRFLGLNVSTFILMMVGATIFMLSGHPSFAADVAASGISSGEGLRYIGAALSTGMSAIGAGIAVAASGAAAIGAISEDPKLLGRTVIFVGLSEGIAIYGLIISIMILS